jgi:hypothetical protein
MFVARTIDELLAGPNLNLYDVVDSGKYELFDIISYAMYAPFAYFFIYVIDKYQIRGFYLFLYISISSLLGLGFEAICEILELFTYIEWKLSYSLAAYLIFQPATLLFYKLISYSHQKAINK